jgi:hypothetical protein
MEMILAMFVLAAAEPVLEPYQQELVDCVTKNAIELGAGNSEPAADVIRAADARCHDQWKNARDIYEGMNVVLRYAGPGALSDHVRRGGSLPDPDEIERRDRDLVFARAFEALIAARR